MTRYPPPEAGVYVVRPQGPRRPSGRQCLRINALGDTRADPDCDRIAAYAPPIRHELKPLSQANPEIPRTGLVAPARP